MPSGGTRIGSGAPAGNTNALKTGRYSPRYVRGACVIALAPSFHEVMHALRRSHRALGGDPAARRRDYDALMAGAIDLAYGITCRDAVLIGALLDVVNQYAPGRRIDARPPTPTRPERDPVTAALLVANELAKRMSPSPNPWPAASSSASTLLARAPVPARA